MLPNPPGRRGDAFDVNLARNIFHCFTYGAGAGRRPDCRKANAVTAQLKRADVHAPSFWLDLTAASINATPRAPSSTFGVPVAGIAETSWFCGDVGPPAAHEDPELTAASGTAIIDSRTQSDSKIRRTSLTASTPRDSAHRTPRRVTASRSTAGRRAA